jgi:hypothetical protein
MDSGIFIMVLAWVVVHPRPLVDAYLSLLAPTISPDWCTREM